ncbi:hypothetical protein SAMN05443665_101097 [Actinomadura meyerae]|jgi:hypothetical protein|uniref:Lipoprotein n=1 Tax=Actinomadura meyerae TaxID=240840 RepID=A0A239HQZ8_9ACTN|nr:hypothetical protein [Actinomadura meyerae]SNS83605.1 hypothetical protein SAMN05443665_101097 [Actinomadura meyerae]
MRLRILAALPLALALALTGCGSDDGGDTGVASAGGAKQEGAAGGAKPNPDEMGVKFAQCMREHGVDMEDPKPGKGVQLKVKGKKEIVEKAMEACRQYNPQANATGAPDPEMQERAREHAECMRQHGVEAFPDPKPGQRGIRIDGKVGQDPDFEAAEQECQKILQGGK